MPQRLARLGIDTLLVLVALTESQAEVLSTTETVLTVVAALGLFLRRRAPWLSMLLALPALVVVSASIAALVALYSLARADQHRWPTAVAGVAVFAASANTWWGGGVLGVSVDSVVYAAMSAAAPIALGLLVRARSELTVRLRELDAARQNERRLVAEEVLAAERARLAREMHDVVSHQVSLIAVQSGALQVAGADETTRSTARTIRGLATRTLEELRQMVALLRSDAAEASAAPQPTIADLEELVSSSGIPTTLTVDLPDDLSSSAQRAVYRTVQEGLTNIRKHAPGAEASVSARTLDDAVEVVVRNGPGTRGGTQWPASGHGLIGLRERADLLDGTLDTHADDDGGYRLRLRLPRR